MFVKIKRICSYYIPVIEALICIYLRTHSSAFYRLPTLKEVLFEWDFNYFMMLPTSHQALCRTHGRLQSHTHTLTMNLERSFRETLNHSHHALHGVWERHCWSIMSIMSLFFTEPPSWLRIHLGPRKSLPIHQNWLLDECELFTIPDQADCTKVLTVQRLGLSPDLLGHMYQSSSSLVAGLAFLPQGPVSLPTSSGVIACQVCRKLAFPGCGFGMALWRLSSSIFNTMRSGDASVYGAVSESGEISFITHSKTSCTLSFSLSPSQAWQLLLCFCPHVASSKFSLNRLSLPRTILSPCTFHIAP